MEAKDITILGGMKELSVEEVSGKIQKIAHLYKSLMNEGTDYGTIPGVEKPSLFKPGAEKLRLAFGLALGEPELTERELPNNHREYRMKIAIIHAATGQIICYGFGVASTMESKHRWREDIKRTDVGPVPKEYWDIPRDDFAARDSYLQLTYGPGKYRTKKVDGQWVVQKSEGTGEKIENPDVADLYNTVLKMCEKRAVMDATISATAASGMFTQDVEDFTETDARPLKPDETAHKEPIDRTPPKGDKPAKPKAPETTPQKSGTYPIMHEGKPDYLASIIALVNSKVPQAERAEYMAQAKETGADMKAIFDDIMVNYASQGELEVE